MSVETQAQPQSLIQGWRIKAVLTVFLIGAAYILAHLFQLQILENNVMAAHVSNLTTKEEVIPAVRGLIRDAKGYLLAGNTSSFDLYIDKSNKDAAEVRSMTDLLGPTLGESSDDLYTRIMGITYTNILLDRRLSSDTASQIRQLTTQWKDVFDGRIWLDDQPARAYPNNTFAANVLGFTDYDGNGQYGVEQFYNTQLAGTPGSFTAERDSKGYALPVGDSITKPAIDGSDIQLTIDSAVQRIAERQLKQALQDTGAGSGMIMIMDPKTGEILALAIAPTFDPNHFTQITDWDIVKNPAISDVYEPGSTFKTITYGSGLDSGAITRQTTVFSSGYMTAYGVTLHNATYAAYGIETMDQGLARSDNIAAAFVSTQMGESKFYDYVQKFGFGQLTGIDMSGEVPGTLWLPGSDYYTPLNLYTNSFGQGLSATPIQLVTGISALINGGNLMKPHIVSKITGPDGQVTQENKPTIVRRAISEAASEQIKGMMVNNVDSMVNPAGIAGYEVGAKTGTAQIPDGHGNYLDDGTIASVVGFAPAADPKFLALVRLNKPTSSQWGGDTASPVFARLGAELLQYYKIPPTEPTN